MHLHIDPYSGVSGDMMLGALVDLGVDVAALEAGLRGLPIGPFNLRAERVMRQGIAGTQVHVEVEEERFPESRLAQILEKLDAAKLPQRVSERAREAFTRLAEAEARVHGSTVEKIHFHEVGQKDAIIDVAGSMLGLELLGVDTVSIAPITVGSGVVECMHGIMPVPPPATAELLRGLPYAAGPIAKEMATPTGVAIICALTGARAEHPIAAGMPEGMRTERVGYGAGTRIIEGHANYLRLWLGRVAPVAPVADERHGAGAAAALPIETDTIASLECEIDDMSPEIAGYLMERLLAEGARDVQFAAVQMKKNRPGLSVRVLCDESREAALAEIIFRETSTFGIRRQKIERWRLRRRADTVETVFGAVAVKIGLWDERILKVTPEYESCRALAQSRGVALTVVYETARAAIRAQFGSGLDSGAPSKGSVNS